MNVRKIARIALKTILWIIGSLLFLLILLIVLLRIPSVQLFAVQQVTQYLENRIQTPVNIGYINLEFPKKLVLKDIYFEDQSRDTLLAGESLKVDFNLWKLLNDTLKVDEIELVGITANINRTLPDSAFNFDYILTALQSPEPKKPTAIADTTKSDSPPMVFDIGDLKLKNIRATYKDEVSGMDLNIYLGDLFGDIDHFNLNNNMHFGIPDIQISNLKGNIRQWTPENYVPAESEESLLPQIDLKDIALKNIDIIYVNSSSGIDTRFDIQTFDGKINELDLNSQNVRIESVALLNSTSHVVFQHANAASPADDIETNLESDSVETKGWTVVVNQLKIDETQFVFRDDNQKRITKGLDYFNLSLQNLEVDLHDLVYNSEEIAGDLRNLKVRDHSGLQIQKLQAQFDYRDSGAKLENLVLQTPKTLIRDKIIVEYSSLDEAINNLGSIGIDANLNRSHLAMEDILYFLPDLDTMQVLENMWPQTFHIDSRIQGKLNNLSIPKLSISTLDETRIVANARIQGLPDMEKIQMNLDLTQFQTSRNNLESILPRGILPDSIRIPEQINLSGNFVGGMSQFNTQLNLESTSGNVTLEGEFNTLLNAQVRDTVYNFDLKIQDLRLGQILKQDSLIGAVNLNAQINGKGLDPKNITATALVDLQSAEFSGYTYQDIQLNANAEEGKYTVTAESLDPNIDLELEAFADLTQQYPQAQGELMINSINFKNLNLMEDELRYHGRVILDFETADINYLNGFIQIKESSIAYNDERYVLSQVDLTAKATDTTHVIQLNSEIVDAHMTGHFTLTELPKAIQDIVAVYYQPDSTQVQYTYEPQQFAFSARLKRSRFVRDFLPELTEMRDVTLDMSFNSEDKFILAKVLAPKIVYGGTEIEDVGVDITTFDSTLYYNALIKTIGISDLELINTLISGNVVQNQVDLGLWIKDQTDKERYHIQLGIGVENQDFSVKLRENGLMLNYDIWDINPENALYFGRNGLRAQNFELTHDNQALILQSQNDSLNAPIDLLFDNFRIETFTQLLESEILDFGGGINGMATLSRLESNPVFVSDLNIEDFYYNTDTIGNVLLRVNNEKENIYSADIYIVENGNYVNLVGDYIAIPNQEPKLDFKLDLRPLNMKTLEAFSFGYLKETEGTINGLLNITGSPAKPLIKGDLNFRDAALNVSMFNAKFALQNERIQFDERGLRFNNFQLRDQKNNIARLNGSVLTTTYSDFDFDLTLVTSDFQVLNSTRVDNDLYYGDLFISSNLKIGGNLNLPVIDGTLFVNDNTAVTFVLPNEDPGLVEREGIIKFVNKADTAAVNYFASLDSLTTTQIGGINLSVNIQTHEDALFSIVLDPASEDALNIQGEAELTAGMDVSGKISLTGTYTVSGGSYTFTLDPVKRVFDFRKGSTITWTGDPLDARLDITASYSLRAPTLELVQNQIGSENTNLYKQRVPFDVILEITGEMLKPDLNFSIDLDEGNALISQDVASKVNTSLSLLSEDESELNKQVFALIILGKFMAANPFESISGGGNGIESRARSTVSSLLSSQLNKFAGDLIKGVELDFDLQSGQDYSTGTVLNRTDLNIGVSKLLFDDRLKITIGSNFELEGNARPGENTTNIAGDISIDYQLSKDGRYFLRAYRKNQYQVTLQGQFVETGIGFIINMDYNEFSELFRKTKEVADLFDVDNRNNTGRFDRERIRTDSVYRDSVRMVIRDSLERINPEIRNRNKDRSDSLNRVPDSVRVNSGDQSRIPDSSSRSSSIANAIIFRNEYD